MRAPVAASFALLVLVLPIAACGGAKKDADNPENSERADGVDDGGPAPAADVPAPADSAAPAASAAPGDDATKKSGPCSGFEIADLASMISQSECEVPDAKETDQKDLSKILEIKVVPDSPRIGPGATSTITVTYKNKGPKELSLDFVVDPEPRFDFEVYTLKGNRADKPKGNEPALPPEVANTPVPDAKIARIKLAQQGTAKLTLHWTAVDYKWASKDKARGALPGHGYPKEPNKPLKKGSYILRVITPLTGVFEGVDHEVSQPRVQITIAPMP
jgi:hypothetical protein